MTRSQLTLLVFDPAEEDEYDDAPPPSACTIDVYFRTRPVWRSGPSRTLLQCDALTPSENADMNPFGVLAHIVPQLEEASVRLGRGELAVLLTSTCNNPSVYVRLDPRPDGTTTWTFLGALPEPYEGYYPLAVSPNHVGVGIDQRAELYAYLEGGGTGDRYALARAVLDTERLREALQDQARLGARLLEYLAE